MARYIDADALIEHLEDNLRECGNPDMTTKPITYGCIIGLKNVLSYAETLPTAEVVEVRHGKWDLEIRSYYADNWDESVELVVYMLAKCQYCGQNHNPRQIFTTRYYAPVDAPEGFRFNKADIISQALNEFKQENYKFQNFCPNCGVKMDGGVTE